MDSVGGGVVADIFRDPYSVGGGVVAAAGFFPLTAVTLKGVTMHRCTDASRYLGRRYVYRIVTQVSRY